MRILSGVVLHEPFPLADPRCAHDAENVAAPKDLRVVFPHVSEFCALHPRRNRPLRGKSDPRSTSLKSSSSEHPGLRAGASAAAAETAQKEPVRATFPDVVTSQQEDCHEIHSSSME